MDILNELQLRYTDMCQKFEGGLSNTSTKKFDPIIQLFSENFNLPTEDIYAVGSGCRPGNIEVRLSQGTRATQHTKLGLTFIVDEKGTPENTEKLTNSAFVTIEKFLGRGKSSYENVLVIVDSNGMISVSGLVYSNKSIISKQLIETLSIPMSKEVEVHHLNENLSFTNVILQNDILIQKVKTAFERFLRLTNKQMENRVHYIDVLEKELSPLLAKIDDSLSSIYQVVSISYLKSLIRNLVIQDNSWQHLLAETWSDANVSSSMYKVWTIYRQYYNYLSIIDISDFRANIDEEKIQNKLQLNSNQPLQQIFYGAPGTGKSFTIDNMADDDRTVRTTFHPDSDYASFVGAYKPTMENIPINVIDNESVQFATGKNGHPGTERKIVYKYVPQAFLKAYVEAWKDLDNPHYLVIEEINRGNCAQIFGDLFQLLDRNAMGCSSYAIHADDDIRQFLASDEKGFGGLSEEQAEAIRSFVLVKDNGSQKQIGEQILNGEQLLLPPNLYIWATMNTSDQSLFPIDSAFKRRWNWKFVPINYEQKDWLLHIGDSYYRWGDFLKQINPIIFSLTESSDKQMGYFFAKPDEKIGQNDKDNNTISEDIFLNKVLFYIWTDILKDFDAGKEPFINPETGRTYEFSDFFRTDKNRVVEFITKSQFELEEVEIDLLDMDGETPIRNGFKVLVDGITFNRITSALHQILLVKANEYTYDGLKSVLSNCIKRDDEFIKTIPTAVGYERESGWYGKPLTSSDNISFIITNQWNKSFIPQIKELAETLGVTFEEFGE